MGYNFYSRCFLVRGRLFWPHGIAKALKKLHVGHFCHPGEHKRVKTLLDIGRLCNYGTPREGISRIGQRLARHGMTWSRWGHQYRRMYPRGLLCYQRAAFLFTHGIWTHVPQLRSWLSMVSWMCALCCCSETDCLLHVRHDMIRLGSPILWVARHPILAAPHPNLSWATPSLSCARPSLICAAPYLSCTAPYLSCAAPYLSCAAFFLSCAAPYMSCATPYFELRLTLFELRCTLFKLCCTLF